MSVACQHGDVIYEVTKECVGDDLKLSIGCQLNRNMKVGCSCVTKNEI